MNWIQSLFLTPPLLHGVVGVLRGVTDDLEREGGVVPVNGVCVQVLEVILKQEFVLRQPLDRLQHEVLQLEIPTSRLLLELFDKLPELWISLTNLIKVEVHC